MKLRPPASLSGRTLDRVEAIYRDAFSDRLRAPFADLLRDHTLVLVDDGEPRGFAVLRDLDDTGWAFLRDFAAADRGHGVGTTLWTQVRDAIARSGRTRIVFDVEDPAEQGLDENEIGIRWRRIRFYLRLGVQLLPVRDYTPPHGDDSHPMLVMAINIDDRAEPIVGPDLSRLVATVYKHRYRLDHTDPTVQTTLRRSGL